MKNGVCQSFYFKKTRWHPYFLSFIILDDISLIATIMKHSQTCAQNSTPSNTPKWKQGHFTLPTNWPSLTPHFLSLLCAAVHFLSEEGRKPLNPGGWTRLPPDHFQLYISMIPLHTQHPCFCCCLFILSWRSWLVSKAKHEKWTGEILPSVSVVPKKL